MLKNTLRRRTKSIRKTEETRPSNDTTSDTDKKLLISSPKKKNMSKIESPSKGLDDDRLDFRKSITKQSKERIRNRLHAIAEGIPEVHFIGEVHSGDEFNNLSLSCKWTIKWGKSWSFLAGEFDGQTQYSDSSWNHPIDVHFATANMKGWPHIALQLWEIDEYNRTNLVAYGFSHLPSSPGFHVIDVNCWRIIGSQLDEIHSFFLGTTTQLNDEDVVSEKGWNNRHKLVTCSAGQVKIHLNTVLRYFRENYVDFPY